MMERAFVIAAFGDRTLQVQRLIKNIRSYVDYPIHIITTKDSIVEPFTNYLKTTSYFPAEGDFPLSGKGKLPNVNVHIEYVERPWPKGSYREGIRNSNYFKVKFALNHHYHSLCMLDDDMYIIDKNFNAGFAIAERFGVAIPANPRIFNYYNMQGADCRMVDWTECAGTKLMMPAVNFSPFFVYPHHGYTANFLHALHIELKNVPCRGTVALVKAMWNSKFMPVILPEQWCVCGSNAQHIKDYTKILRGKEVNIKPIMLHLGHDEVRKVFADIIEEN